MSSDLRDESILETNDTKRSSIDSSFEPLHTSADVLPPNVEMVVDADVLSSNDVITGT